MIDVRMETIISCCRCCGAMIGALFVPAPSPIAASMQQVCHYCTARVNEGYTILIELTDDSLAENESSVRTGYIAELEQGSYEGTTPGIFTIRKSDLQQFLGHKYNNDATMYNKFRLPEYRPEAGP